MKSSALGNIKLLLDVMDGRRLYYCFYNSYGKKQIQWKVAAQVWSHEKHVKIQFRHFYIRFSNFIVITQMK